MLNILITGVNGFLGSFVARQLLLNHHVIGLKRSRSDLFRVKDLLDDIQFYNVDEISINEVFLNHSIDVIIHTATNYGTNSTEEEIRQSNINYPISILEAAKGSQAKLFINTDTFYTPNYGALQFYAKTKEEFLSKAKAYRNIKIVNLKIGIIFGPSDHRNKFTTTMIHQMLINKSSIDLTEGLQKRNFLFIEEAACIYETIVNEEHMIKNQYSDFVIGSGESTFIRSYLELMHRIIGSESQLNFGAIAYRDNEIMSPNGSIDEILALGWKPKLTLEEGLVKTIDYEKNILNHA